MECVEHWNLTQWHLDDSARLACLSNWCTRPWRSKANGRCRTVPLCTLLAFVKADHSREVTSSSCPHCQTNTSLPSHNRFLTCQESGFALLKFKSALSTLLMVCIPSRAILTTSPHVFHVDLRTFIDNNDMADPSIRGSIHIKARVLFYKEDDFKDSHFLRMYCGEVRAKESLQEQQQVGSTTLYELIAHPLYSSLSHQAFIEAQEADPMIANQYLITASIYGEKKCNPNLPREGDVISFTPHKLRTYHRCCQVDVALKSIELQFGSS